MRRTLLLLSFLLLSFSMGSRTRAADLSLLGLGSDPGAPLAADGAVTSTAESFAAVEHAEPVLVASLASPGTTAGARPVQSGVASYYGHGDGFHGRRTANGEIFDAYGRMTAAHTTMRFGTKLRVVNRANGRSVVVRINDRGPYVGSRILDLSYVAAKELGMLSSGTARVDLYVVR